jgi:hypothetical protein
VIRVARSSSSTRSNGALSKSTTTIKAVSRTRKYNGHFAVIKERLRNVLVVHRSCQKLRLMSSKRLSHHRRRYVECLTKTSPSTSSSMKTKQRRSTPVLIVLNMLLNAVGTLVALLYESLQSLRLIVLLGLPGHTNMYTGLKNSGTRSFS